MPFACEDCGVMGARMNSIFKIRLCVKCLGSLKYRLMSKSRALNEYTLTQTDVDNYPIPLKKYLVNNPHYKLGPPMTLYYLTQIEQVFLFKHNDLIVKLSILEPFSNIEQTAKIIKDYHKEQKYMKKQQKNYKILDKYNIKLEEDLPVCIQEKLMKINNVKEYEHIISNYVRLTNKIN